jgi:hypothetical protein
MKRVYTEQIAFRLPKACKAKIALGALALGMSVSDFIRHALGQYCSLSDMQILVRGELASIMLAERQIEKRKALTSQDRKKLPAPDGQIKK